MLARRNVYAILGLTLLFSLTARAGEIVEVEVTGEGVSEELALKDALRKALEQGGGQEIFSESHVENFELIRDTIYSRAEGIVTDYKILNKTEGMGGTVSVTIRAKVDKDAIASGWGAVQNVLDQIGRPGVMVMIKEYVDDVLDDSSILESKIKERLVKSGFDVYDSQQVKEITKRESADAATEENMAKVNALAKNFGTQIFITGVAHANAAGVRQVYGEDLATYNCDAEASMFYTDTGKLISVESLPATRGAARGHFTVSKQAGKVALTDAGTQLVEMIYAGVMKNWATQISAGGEIRIEVGGCSYKQANDLKKALSEVDKVERVNMQFSKGIANFRIVANMTGEDLAGIISDKGLFDIADVTLNRIQGTASGE